MGLSAQKEQIWGDGEAREMKQERSMCSREWQKRGPSPCTHISTRAPLFAPSALHLPAGVAAVVPTQAVPRAPAGSAVPKSLIRDQRASLCGEPGRGIAPGESWLRGREQGLFL